MKLEDLQKRAEQLKKQQKELINDIEAFKNSVEKYEPKDGEFVLGVKGGAEFIGIFKKREYDHVYFHAVVDWEGDFAINDYWLMAKITKLSKEKTDFLLSKMKENGYTWNAEEKKVERVLKGNFMPSFYIEEDRYKPVWLSYETSSNRSVTKEECQKLCDQFNEILNKRKEV